MSSSQKEVVLYHPLNDHENCPRQEAMHQVACSKLRELRDGVNYASKYGISTPGPVFHKAPEETNGYTICIPKRHRY